MGIEAFKTHNVGSSSIGKMTVLHDCISLVGEGNFFMNFLPVLSAIVGMITLWDVQSIYRSVWRQVIYPKKWRENFPASKIKFLFMA